MVWAFYESDVLLKEVKTVEDIDDFLSRFKKERGEKRPIIFLNSPSTSYMYVGISNDLCFLNFNDEDNNVLDLTSIGNKEMELTKDSIDFYICGHHSQIPLRNCIDFKTMVMVLKEYFMNDKKPDLIEWENV